MENKKITPIVGQQLFAFNIGNAARFRAAVLQPVVVTKVGRKYFTVGEGRSAVDFHLENWRQKTEYSPSIKLYESEKQHAEEREVAKICEKIRDTFKYGGGASVGIDKLRLVDCILFGGEDSKMIEPSSLSLGMPAPCVAPPQKQSI